MMMKIKIGKSPENDIIVDEPDVSRFHACLIKHPGTESWMLEDLNSTNGTYVNDIQICKKIIKPDDYIRFGKKCHFSLLQMQQATNNYSEGFAALKLVYENYMNEKVRVQSSNQFKIRIFQSLPLALPGLIGVVIGFSGKGSPLLFGLSLSVAVCAPVAGIYLGARQSAQIPLKLQALNDQFKIDYVCPKCGTFLGEIPWESLRNRKQCPVSSCKAKWIEE